MTKSAFKDDERVTYKDINAQPRIDMDGTHPSIEGTKELIKRIDNVVNIVEDERYIVNERNLYTEVTTRFMYGCLLCDTIWDIEYGYCKECLPFLLKHIGLEYQEPIGGKRGSENVSSEEVENKKQNLNSTPNEEDNSVSTFGILTSYAETVMAPLMHDEEEELNLNDG